MASSAGDLGRKLVRLDNRKKALAKELNNVVSDIAKLTLDREQLETSIAEVESSSREAIRQHTEGVSEAPPVMVTPQSIDMPSRTPEARPSSSLGNTAPSLRIKIKVPQKSRDIATPTDQATPKLSPAAQSILNKSPEDAPGIPMHNGPNIIHEHYPTIVLISGLWYDVSCHLCGANSTPVQSRFFRGIGGLRLHVAKVHYEGIRVPKDAITQCIRHLVTVGDAALMLEGSPPVDFAVVKIQAQDDLSSDEASDPLKKFADGSLSADTLPDAKLPSSTNAVQMEGQDGIEGMVRDGLEKQVIHPKWPNIIWLDGNWVEVKCSACGANASINDRHFMPLRGVKGHFSRAHGLLSSTPTYYSRRVVSALDAYLMQDGNYPLDHEIEMVSSEQPSSKPSRRSQIKRTSSSSSEDADGPLTEYEIFENLTAEARASGTPQLKRRNRKKRSWGEIHSDEDVTK